MYYRQGLFFVSRIVPLLAALLTTACATDPPVISTSPCVAQFNELDTRVHRAGVTDAGSHPVPGFPYLRSNRFLASFAEEAGRDGLDSPKFAAWVARMRELDMASRGIELRNLRHPDQRAVMQRLETCGITLTGKLTTEQRRALIAAAAVPEDYSMPARALGLYPLAVPFLRAGVSEFHEEVADSFATPLPSGSGTILWQPPRARRATARKHTVDALGIPLISRMQWQTLAMRHAPSWWIETEGFHDFPAAPVIDDGEVATDINKPTVYYRSSFTRFGDAVLPQISYLVWFSERPPLKAIDPYAGQFDGLIWRVTLDRKGDPMIYDSIHACGCYHYFFTPQELVRAGPPGPAEEPILVPQAEVPAADLALRVQSATHYLQRVATVSDVSAEIVNSYELAPYDRLLQLPDGRGGTRSLFDDRGMLPVSKRLERFWLWPSGVRSPGAMRQWGRHATAFIGKRHFDDARLMERVFVPQF